MQHDGLMNEVEGVRYVDDLTCFVFYDKDSASDKQQALDIAKRIQYGYHKNMELEVEDTNKKFKFLSSEIKVNKENFRIRSRFYNKNQRQINEGKPQLFPTYQHFESFAPARQKLSVVISAIHRIGNACNSTAAVQSAFNTLRRELELPKYPTQIISRALWRVRNNDGRWHAIHMSSNRPHAQDLRSGRQGGARNNLVQNPTEWPARRSK